MLHSFFAYDDDDDERNDGQYDVVVVLSGHPYCRCLLPHLGRLEDLQTNPRTL